MRVWIGLSVVLLSGSVFAQERPENRDEDQQPLRHIQVLENPYDIASFYRSSQGYGLGPTLGQDRYPIASYYRNHQASPFASFWSRGYTAAAPGYVLGYRRSIGQNGDLFLLAPTFLAPIGPLTGAFASGW